jgi:hypothetical protein
MWAEAHEVFEKLVLHDPCTPEMLHLLVGAAANDASSAAREVAGIASAAWIDGCELMSGTLLRNTISNPAAACAAVWRCF